MKHLAARDQGSFKWDIVQFPKEQWKAFPPPSALYQFPTAEDPGSFWGHVLSGGLNQMCVM